MLNKENPVLFEISSKKRSDTYKLWRPVLQLTKPHFRVFIFVSILTLLSTGADLIEPLIYRMAVNDVAGLFVHHTLVVERGTEGEKPDTTQQHHRGLIAPRTAEQTFSTLLWAVLFLFLTNISSRFFSLAADNISARTSNKIEEDLIIKTFNHVMRLPFSFFGSRSSGAVAKQIDQSDQVAPIVAALTQQLIPEAMRLIGIFAIMFFQNAELAIAAVATMPFYVWISRQMAKKLESNMAAYYELWEGVSARILDGLSGVKTIKLSGTESREVERLKKTTSEAYKTYLERVKIENKYLFGQSFLINVGKALVLGLGGWKVMEHQLTPGDVVMFVAYLDRIYDPVESLTSLMTTLQQHIASVVRALRLLGKGVEEPTGRILEPGPGRVEFKDVVFNYTPKHDVLRGLSLTIEPGKVTALVGPSGAGKTTTVDLLMRLYETGGGAIFIDNQPLATLDPSAVRRAIGVVSADGALFRDTLAYNIRYKRPEASDKEVIEAARATGLGRTIERLQDGLETEVGERGVGLSSGERQRLLIARVLAGNPHILIFDEATANLDYAAEYEVKAALEKILRGRTALIIAHRYSMVKDVDYVYVIDDGRIAEQGTPTELITTNGWFAQLARSSATNT